MALTKIIGAGVGSLTENLVLGDSDKALFGAGSDLQIFHDGSNSFINNTVTGALSIKSDDINLMSSSSETMATLVEDGAVTLYHNNAAKIATASTGVNVTGGVGLGGTSAANILDDYEEGTWTVTDLSGAGMSLTVYVSTYTKIGNQVFFEIGMVFPSTSSTADLKISLPFTAINSSDNTGGAFVTTTNSGRSDNFVVGRNTINLSGVNNNNVSAKNNNYSGNQLRCAGQYTTP